MSDIESKLSKALAESASRFAQTDDELRQLVAQLKELESVSDAFHIAGRNLDESRKLLLEVGRNSQVLADSARQQFEAVGSLAKAIDALSLENMPAELKDLRVRVEEILTENREAKSALTSGLADVQEQLAGIDNRLSLRVKEAAEQSTAQVHAGIQHLSRFAYVGLGLLLLSMVMLATQMGA